MSYWWRMAYVAKWELPRPSRSEIKSKHTSGISRYGLSSSQPDCWKPVRCKALSLMSYFAKRFS